MARRGRRASNFSYGGAVHTVARSVLRLQDAQCGSHEKSLLGTRLFMTELSTKELLRPSERMR